MKKLISSDQIMDETYTDVQQYFVNSSLKKEDFLDLEINKIYKEDRDIILNPNDEPLYDNIEVRYYIFSNHVDHDKENNPLIKGPSHFKLIGKEGSKDKVCLILLHLYEKTYTHFIKNTSLIDNLLVNIATSTFEKDLKHAQNNPDGKNDTQIDFAISQNTIRK